MRPDFGEFGVYFVALKLALWRGGRVLILRDGAHGWLDLPGGRTEADEYGKPLEKILAREVREEIGAVRYALGKPAFQYRRWHHTRRVHIFTTVYEARYLSGKITLSDEHGSYEWADPAAIRLGTHLFTTAEERRAFKKYFTAAGKKR
jgi:8-oxo-dGTP pyrophosphatase MutT (NUDIX family)